MKLIIIMYYYTLQRLKVDKVGKLMQGKAKGVNSQNEPLVLSRTFTLNPIMRICPRMLSP